MTAAPSPAPAAPLRKAAAAHEAGLTSEAEPLYRRALALAPARRGLGCLLVQTGRAEEGAALLEGVVETNPRDAFANLHLGLAWLTLRRPAPALAALELALLAEPRLAAAWFYRAQALSALGREDEAAACLDNALRLAPQLYEAWLNKGNILSRRGDLPGAIAAYDRASACLPSAPAPWFNRANALRDGGRLDDAAQAYQAALARDANFYAAAVNLANLYVSLERRREADEAYARAIEMRADEPEAWLNRGAALTRAGRPDAALPFLTKASELRPGLADAAYNLGLALRDLSAPQAALDAFDRALAAAPSHAKATNGRGLALRDLNRPEEALAAYDVALRLDPDLTEAAINRASLLNAHGRSRAALATLDRALARAPGSAAAWAARGHAQFETNDNDGALESHAQALRIDPDFASARFGAVIANLRILYSDDADIARRRAAYGHALDRLAEWALNRTPSDELLRAAARHQPFFLAYQNEDDCALQRRYGGLIRALVARRYPDAPAPPLVAGEKLRIGFVSAFFRNHSNWKIPIRGWLEGLDRGRFQITAYHLGRESDAETERAARLCDRFVAGPMTEAAWREQILADRPHALIYPGLAMDETSLILAAQRLAPVQCNSWGHPETSGLPTSDYFLGSQAMDPPGAEAFYSERLVRLPGLSFVPCRPTVEAAPMRRLDLGLGDAAFVFWSGQTLMKYLPAFDDVFARIAQAVPRAQFVFLRFPRAPEITAIFRRRLMRAFARRGLDGERHCRFVGPFSQAEFLGAMNCCDALIDTIGWSACNSMIESLEAALPAVTLPGRFLRSRHVATILRALGDDAGVTASLDGYIAEAVRLAEDPTHLRARKAKLTGGARRLAGDRSCVAALETFLETAIPRACGHAGS